MTTLEKHIIATPWEGKDEQFCKDIMGVLVSSGVKNLEQFIKSELDAFEWGSCPGKAAKKGFLKDAKLLLVGKPSTATPHNSGTIVLHDCDCMCAFVLCQGWRTKMRSH